MNNHYLRRAILRDKDYIRPLWQTHAPDAVYDIFGLGDDNSSEDSAEEQYKERARYISRTLQERYISPLQGLSGDDALILASQYDEIVKALLSPYSAEMAASMDGYSTHDVLVAVIGQP